MKIFVLFFFAKKQGDIPPFLCLWPEGIGNRPRKVDDGMLDYVLPTVNRPRPDDHPEADERDRPSCPAEQAPRVDSDHQPGSDLHGAINTVCLRPKADKAE